MSRQSTDSSHPSLPHEGLNRRAILKGTGAGFVAGFAGACTATGVDPIVPVGAALLGEPRQTMPTPSQFNFAPVVDVMDKPTIVATSRDPLGYSIADNLFWNDIMMEHAFFFVSLMPPINARLVATQKEAMQFQHLFSQQLERSRALNAASYVAFNQSSIDLARRFADWKRSKEREQASGALQSYVWPLFFHHTAREADRFAARLSLYNRGSIEFSRAEVVEFWSATMGEHSAFIAHLLDPQETLLISNARRLQGAFANIRASGSGGPVVMQAAHEVLQFKTVGEKGIRMGIVKSIIPPALAAHVRREAVRFIDELQRAA